MNPGSKCMLLIVNSLDNKQGQKVRVLVQSYLDVLFGSTDLLFVHIYISVLTKQFQSYFSITDIH